MISVDLKDFPKLKKLIWACFPNYRKKKAFVSEFSGRQNVNSYWDGGSKSEFAIVEIATGHRKQLPSSSHPYFDIAGQGMANRASEFVESDRVGNVYLKYLPAGFALIEAGTFMGRPATAHVRVGVDDMKLIEVNERKMLS